jgi:hypothetical protein
MCACSLCCMDGLRRNSVHVVVDLWFVDKYGNDQIDSSLNLKVPAGIWLCSYRCCISYVSPFSAQ